MSDINFKVYSDDQVVFDMLIKKNYISWSEDEKFWFSTLDRTDSHLHVHSYDNEGIWRTSWRTWNNEFNYDALPSEVRHYVYEVEHGKYEELGELFNDSYHVSGSQYRQNYDNESFNDAFYEDELQKNRNSWLGDYANEEKYGNFVPENYHNNPDLEIKARSISGAIAYEEISKRIKEDVRHLGYVGNDTIDDYNELIENALQESRYEEPFNSKQFRNALDGKGNFVPGETHIIINPHREDFNGIHTLKRGENIKNYKEKYIMNEQKNVTAIVTVFEEPLVEENRKKLGMASINVNGISVNSCNIVELYDQETGEPSIVVNLPQRSSPARDGGVAYKNIAGPVGDHSRTVMNEIREVVKSELERVSQIPFSERKEKAYDFSNLERPFVSEKPMITVNRMEIMSKPSEKGYLGFCDITVGNMKLNNFAIRLNQEGALSLKPPAYPVKDSGEWKDYVVIGDKELGQKVRDKVFDRFTREKNAKEMSRDAYSQAIDKSMNDTAKSEPSKNGKSKDKGER